MARFVILQHEAPEGVHWDLMLQSGEVLKTWALSEPPRLGQPIAARCLPEHRLVYLDYEGPLSGGRGHVARWDEGTYQLEDQQEGLLVVRLRGKRLAGRVRLVRAPQDPGQWELSISAETEPPGL